MECMRINFTEGVLLDGRYKTVCPLNHGSFGMVFKAEDVISGDVVALKVLTKAAAVAAGVPAFAVDDRSEELAIHRLVGTHPNIVNLRHSFETEHHIYLVLEYCDNGDLYEALRSFRAPSGTESVREAVLQLIDAVEYMHSNGVYHRDIKPENIFLSESGAMKLGDFGLATMETTSFESAVGSDRYMAPEQMEPSSSGYCPAQADVWAIGICLLNILFSRNPFATPTLSDPLFADFATDRQALFDIFPAMSQDTFEILTHCLGIDPESRSLAAARACVQKAVAFRNDAEFVEDVYVKDPIESISPSRHEREPIPTPVATPQLEAVKAFPWARALAMTPPVRQLSVIPDAELGDDFFNPTITVETKNWQDGQVQPDNLSAVSFVDSGLGLSLKSNGLSVSTTSPTSSKPMPMTGSLPISMARAGASMASVFGRRREIVSKSWSDLWDEEEEEQQRAASYQVQHDDSLFFPQPSAVDRRVLDNESSGSDTPRAALAEIKNSETNSRNRTPDGRPVDKRVSEHTGFLFEEEHVDSGAVKHPISPLALKSSSPKRSVMDKWAALGDRRRGNPASPKEEDPETTITAPQDSTPTPVSILSRKRGRAGDWRQNLNWSAVRGQITPQKLEQQPVSTPISADTPSISPESKKGKMMNNDWRKQDSKLSFQVAVDAGRSMGRPFEWVWRM